MKQDRKGGMGWGVVLVVVLLLGAGAFLYLTTRPAPVPQVSVTSDATAVGRKASVQVRASEPERGLSSVRVLLVQAGKERVLEEQSFPQPPPWKPWADKTSETQVTVTVGKDVQAELAEGTLTVRAVVARARGLLTEPEPAVQELTLPVHLTPPALSAASQAVHVTQGGVEVVLYTVGPTAVRDGVQAGAWYFPGHPLPGAKPTEHFAFFAVPYDMGDPAGIKLIAEDAVGNRAEAGGFIQKFFPRPPGTDTITLNDKFMEKVTGEIAAHVPDVPVQGTLLEKFLTINGTVRRKNVEQLRQLCLKSKPEFFWKQTFAPTMNAKIMGAFADHRTYVYEGKAVDAQDHLGFDLASVQAAPVLSGNPGEVLWADYLGIYGNCVLVDHGYGLTSFYAHLSALDVKAGDRVERGQVLGKSGATGMAGGDHLHFVFLLYGLAVNPIEWWDGHWIHDRLVLKLGDVLPFESGGEAFPFPAKGGGKHAKHRR